MQITREDLPDRQVALTLEFEPQEIEPALHKTYQRLVGKVNIPGFRPGKAPRQIFERYVGRESLVREAIEGLTTPAIKDALAREKLQDAQLSDMDVESTDPLKVRVLVDQAPLVEVGDYYDIRVPSEPQDVTPEHVDAAIDALRRREAVWSPPAEPRPARLGDRVTADLETFTISGPVPQLTGTGLVLELSETNAPTWPREMDENLIGMQVDEEKDFAITFPEAYSDEDLRGKEATVHAKITALQAADLPEVNDAFAQRVLQVDTPDALWSKVKDDLQTEATQAARAKQVRTVIDTLKERSRVEVSSHMLNHDIDRRFERLTAELQRRRIAPARYFTYEGTSEKAWRAAQREPARLGLEEMLILAEVAQREHIAVSDAQVTAEIDKMLAPYTDEGQADTLREIFDTADQREQLRNKVFEQNLTDRLVALAEGRLQRPGGTAAAAAGAAAAAEDAAAGEADTPAAAEPAHEPEAAAGAAAPGHGAVPATAQDLGPLEVAGGAAEVLGSGETMAAQPPTGELIESATGGDS